MRVYILSELAIGLFFEDLKILGIFGILEYTLFAGYGSLFPTKKNLQLKNFMASYDSSILTTWLFSSNMMPLSYYKIMPHPLLTFLSIG